jgi:hypothetical protein
MEAPPIRTRLTGLALHVIHKGTVDAVSCCAAANSSGLWSSPIEGSDKRRFFAVLHQGPIKSPGDAVRAAIVAEQREGRQ